MVGHERANWFSDHPSACTCADCTDARRSQSLVDAVVAQGRKIGRNETCPCGSGRKYKKCHGG